MARKKSAKRASAGSRSRKSARKSSRRRATATRGRSGTTRRKASTRRKKATRSPASRRKSARTRTRKSSARKGSARKKSAPRKSAGHKKAASRKPAPKKAAAKKPVARKPAARKPPARPAAGQKAAAPPVPPPVPNAMGLANTHMDFTSHNLEEVKRFYTQQLGFTRFDHDPTFNYLWIQTTHNSSLGFMPPVHGAGIPMPPREATLYLIVQNIDEAYRKLQARGVSFEAPPETMPWGHRVVRTRDPEGRSIVLAQPIRTGNR